MSTLRATLRRLFVALSVIAVLTAAGCAGKQVQEGDAPVDGSNISTPGPDAVTNPAGSSSDDGGAMGMKTVFFPYDSFSLDKTAKSTLKANADIMKNNPNVKIQIEGHCDARGGIQYNIALGEKRANATKKYMEDMGIGGDRITTISFGKERPLDPGTSEEAYAKNRRANFVLTSQ